MARARNIKPSFFTNEQLSDSCPLGRLLFIGLWTLADFKGELEWKSKSIKIQLLPWDNCDIKELAINLDNSGLIRFYSDGDRIYINIPNFSKHQNPHKNEKDKGSEIPSYCESMRQVIDFKELTINRDLSGLKRNNSNSNPAESLLLNPESLILNPDIKQVPKKSDDFSDLFLQAWELYPQRSGANKKDSFKNWKARLKSGCTEIQMIDGIRNYAKYVVDSKTEDKYIKQPQTFLGIGEHFKSKWEHSQKQSTHNDFSSIDYTKGINDDGSF